MDNIDNIQTFYNRHSDVYETIIDVFMICKNMKIIAAEMMGHDVFTGLSENIFSVLTVILSYAYDDMITMQAFLKKEYNVKAPYEMSSEELEEWKRQNKHR